MRRSHAVILTALVAFPAGWLAASARAPRRPADTQADAPLAVPLPASADDRVLLVQVTNPAADPPHSTLFVLRPHAVRRDSRSAHFYSPPPGAKLCSIRLNGAWIFCEQEHVLHSPARLDTRLAP